MYFRKMLPVIILVLIILSLPCSSQEAGPDPEVMTRKIIQEFEDMYGFVPEPVLVLSERVGVVPAFMSYGKRLMLEGPLTPREFNLITLSAATALKSPGCIRNQIRKLKKLGVSGDEIIQTVLIAGMLGNTTTLQESYQILESEGLLSPEE